MGWNEAAVHQTCNFYTPKSLKQPSWALALALASEGSLNVITKQLLSDFRPAVTRSELRLRLWDDSVVLLIC